MATLNRTLLIGLGGTGVEVLRKFKRRFVDLYDREQKYIKLLAFDTAEQLDSTDPRLSPSEFLLLSDPVIRVSEVVQSRHENPSLGWIKSDIPPTDIIAGAGQKRLYGHLSYFWRGRDIRNAISRALDGLFSAQLHQDFEGMQADCRVFVVSSLCGGTGTGMFLDVTYLVQSMIDARRQPASYFGLLFLPSAFQTLKRDDYAWKAVNANGYAALEELNYYMQDKFDSREMFSISDQGKVAITRAPYNLCCLLGGTDTHGFGVESSVELYERTADFLAANAASPEIRNAVVQYLVANSATKRCYASFGSFSMVLPYARYVEQYLLAMGDELLVDVLETQPEGVLPTADAIFDVSPEFKAATAIATTGLDAATSARIQREVKVHADPDDHTEASRFIEQEHGLAIKLRDAVATDAANRGKTLETQVRENLATSLREIWTVRKGALSAVDALILSVVARMDELQKGLSIVVAGRTNSIESAYQKHRAEPNAIEKLFKSDQSKRFIDYRADLEQALVQELRALLAREYANSVARLKADFEQMRRAMSDLRGQSDAIRSSFRETALAFVADHHGPATANPTNDAAASEYANERLGLLSKCKAELSSHSLLGNLDHPRVDVSRFTQELYKIVSKYIFENKSRSQLFEQERLARGIREAEVNVHLKSTPSSELRNVNWLFIPPDQKLKKEVEQVFASTRGGGHVSLQSFDSVDDNVLTYMQFKVEFELKELADIELMHQAYQARVRDNRVYLQLDTHLRRPILQSATDPRPKQLLAFGLMLGALRETGQNLKWNDGTYLLDADVADKVERRLDAYKAVADPDRSRIIETAVRRAADVGNDQFAEQIEKHIGERYSGLNPEDGYEKLLVEEKQILENYIENLGVRRRSARTTN